jgi:hypothetical protein
VGLKLNGAHQLLVYVDDVDLLGDNMDTIKKSTETLTDASKEVGLEINIEETKYMLLSCYQNAGRNWDIKIPKRPFENMSQFKCLGTTVTNKNLFQDEIKRRLNSGNACYHSVQNLLFSRLLSRNWKIRIYKMIILPVVLYGCKALSASELYRSRDRCLSAKLVPTFADEGCHVVSVTDSYGHILGFLDRSHYFFFQVAPQLYSRV